MRALVLAGSLVAVVVLLEACSAPATCSAATCNTCCASDGTCVTAISNTACGSAGNSCTACTTGQTCSATTRSCVTGSGGGAGGGTGGATGGGTGGATGGGTGGATGGGTGGATGGGTGGGTGGAGGGTPITCPGGALPAMVPITFPATCPVPTPCGGNPSGTFNYTAACIGQDEFASFTSRLEQACGAGTVTIKGFDGGIQGFAHFMSNQVCRTVQGSVTVSAFVGGTLCPQGCNLLGSGISQAGFTGACFLDGGACDCTATKTINISNQAAAYTTSATSLTITSTGQTFNTCLTGGNSLSTREIDAGTLGAMGHEPGTATLTKP